MAELFADSGNPDQMPRSAASDLGLHCLPVTHLGVSSLQWVNVWVSTICSDMSIQIFRIKMALRKIL